MELQGAEDLVRGDLRRSIGGGMLGSTKKGATHQGGRKRPNYLVLLPRCLKHTAL